ncbi:MAG: glucose 1-dehydrogenase [Lentisphaerae bacterium]|nr:glucose 1-dehydrogenase [Lentisphaerota bacterium]MCP4101452.1 glucose 1-dehydrogenase [Lentisphaerota bacterium]
MRLKDKIILITGASKGIGAGIALEAAREGAKVVINYHSGFEDAKKIQSKIKETGKDAIIVKADVSKKNEVDGLIEKTLDYFGRIDILVNNSGVALWKPFLETDESNWDSTINVNLKGVFLCSQAVARHMIEKGISGSIVNIGSTAAHASMDCLVPYCASKGGVILLTKSIANALAKNNIRVNCLSPGTTDVKRNRETDKSYPDNWEPYIPLQRPGKIEEIAKAVIFLASDDASYITGQNLFADGGATSYVPMPGADFA